MTVRMSAILMSLLVLIVVAPSMVFANDGGDRVQFFQSITVGPDEHVGDAVCIFCSIRMAGSCGDAVAIFGNIVVDGTVSGDAVSVGGGIKLGEDANVSGDAVAIGRGVYRHPNAVVKGEVVSQAGPVNPSWSDHYSFIAHNSRDRTRGLVGATKPVRSSHPSCVPPLTGVVRQEPGVQTFGQVQQSASLVGARENCKVSEY